MGIATVKRLKDFSPDTRSTLGHADVKGFNVYTDSTGERIGTVNEVLVDEKDGSLRYLVVNTGFWLFGKKVLLPVASPRIHYTQRCIYLSFVYP
jgi:hypothetical protein